MNGLLDFQLQGTAVRLSNRGNAAPPTAHKTKSSPRFSSQENVSHHGRKEPAKLGPTPLVSFQSEPFHIKNVHHYKHNGDDENDRKSFMPHHSNDFRQHIVEDASKAIGKKSPYAHQVHQHQFPHHSRQSKVAWSDPPNLSRIPSHDLLTANSISKKDSPANHGVPKSAPTTGGATTDINCNQKFVSDYTPDVLPTPPHSPHFQSDILVPPRDSLGNDGNDRCEMH
jgi:hypothetical protein